MQASQALQPNLAELEHSRHGSNTFKIPSLGIHALLSIPGESVPLVSMTSAASAKRFGLSFSSGFVARARLSTFASQRFPPPLKPPTYLKETLRNHHFRESPFGTANGAKPPVSLHAQASNVGGRGREGGRAMSPILRVLFVEPSARDMQASPVLGCL